MNAVTPLIEVVGVDGTNARVDRLFSASPVLTNGLVYSYSFAF